MKNERVAHTFIFFQHCLIFYVLFPVVLIIFSFIMASTFKMFGLIMGSFFQFDKCCPKVFASSSLRSMSLLGQLYVFD